MRGIAIAILLSPLAASAAAQSGAPPMDGALKQALAEEKVANSRAAMLDRAASNARNQAERLHAEQAAAAQAVEAAEARISVADARLGLVGAFLAAHRQRLAAEQQPASLLVAALATMVRRPPLLVLADGASTDELVKVRLLLETTLPAIRERTRRVSMELAEGERLEKAALIGRSELANGRHELERRRQRYAALERQAIDSEVATSGQALGASDLALALGENVERLRAEEKGTQSIRLVAQVLARDPPSPPSPFPPSGAVRQVPFSYELPSPAPVVEGVGAVNQSGVLARGITIATRRGSPVAAPADGTIRFAGPYRDYDGVLIIDHGSGWLSLIVNAASPLHVGDKVQRGDEIGRAMGPLQLELSRNGRRLSPALIAGSSENLSKKPKGG